MTNTTTYAVFLSTVLLAGGSAVSARAHDFVSHYKGYRGGCISGPGFGHHRPFRGHVSGHIGNHSYSAYSFGFGQRYHNGYGGSCGPRYYGRAYRGYDSRVTHYRSSYRGYGYGYGYGTYYGGYASTYERHHSRPDFSSNAYVFYSAPSDSAPSWRSELVRKQEELEAWKRVQAERAAKEKAAGGEASTPVDSEAALQSVADVATGTASAGTKGAVRRPHGELSLSKGPTAVASSGGSGFIYYPDTGERVDGSRIGRRATDSPAPESTEAPEVETAGNE